jgi:hypothetical protein
VIGALPCPLLLTTLAERMDARKELALAARKCIVEGDAEGLIACLRRSGHRVEWNWVAPLWMTDVGGHLRLFDAAIARSHVTIIERFFSFYGAELLNFYYRGDRRNVLFFIGNNSPIRKASTGERMTFCKYLRTKFEKYSLRTTSMMERVNQRSSMGETAVQQYRRWAVEDPVNGERWQDIADELAEVFPEFDPMAGPGGPHSKDALVRDAEIRVAVLSYH